MTQQSAGDVQQELLAHAQRQTKSLESIYALLVTLAILTGVGALVLVISVYTG